ncbi:hypothetical protein N5U18_06440 [Aliarcobacter butzleri]|nr:YtxH domain-containing protein [Aliarcobacter butzleri]MCT7548114.1 hypothetical protein [Aliarcobacter butzleri]
MALPFLLGLALGAGAVVAYNKSDKLKDKTSKILEKTKDGLEEVKEKINSTKETIKEKFEKK